MPLVRAQPGESFIDQTVHPHSSRQYELGSHQYSLANPENTIQSTRNPSTTAQGSLYTDEQNITTRGDTLIIFADMSESLSSEAMGSRLLPASSPLQASYQQRVGPVMDQPQMTASSFNNRVGFSNVGVPSTSGSGQSSPPGGDSFSGSQSINLVPSESSTAAIATDMPKVCNTGQCQLSFKRLATHRETCDGEFRLQVDGIIRCRFQTSKNCPFTASKNQGLTKVLVHELNCKDALVGNDGVRFFRCQYCSTEFSQSKSKTLHESSHCPERPR